MSDGWRESEGTVDWYDPCTPERTKVVEYSVTNGRYRITRVDFSKWWLLDGLQEERKENGNLNQVWFPSLEDAKAAADADNQKWPAMTHTDLIARLRGANEYEPVGHDAWEAADALTAAQERIEALVGALRPFAKSGELFPEEPGTVEFDICVYRPAKGREWGLCGDDLRRARAALDDTYNT